MQTVLSHCISSSQLLLQLLCTSPLHHQGAVTVQDRRQRLPGWMWQKQTKRKKKKFTSTEKKTPLEPHLRHHASVTPRLLPIPSVCDSSVNWKQRKNKQTSDNETERQWKHHLHQYSLLCALLILLATCCLLAVPRQTAHLNVKRERRRSSPWRQGLERATTAIAPRSSSSSSSGLESPCWLGDSSPTKPPEVLGRGSAPRTSIAWLFTSDILLRTSAIWALRRIRTPESGAERRTAWGRRSRSFLEWDWAARGNKETTRDDKTELNSPSTN